MGEQTSIEWCDHTFNAWIGCEKIAPGCKHCYAAELAAFRGWAEWGGEALGGTRRVASETKWREPLKWNRAAERDGVRRRVFCASLADVWEDWRGPMLNADGLPLIHSGSAAPWEPIDLDNAGHGERVTAADVRRRLFELAEATPWLDWLFLTKRPENVRRLWPFAAPFTASDGGADVIRRRLENVWLGASISCQATADANLPELMNLREFSPVLFASAEPLVERIDLDACGATPCDAVPGASYCEAGDACGPFTSWPGLDWLIVGGESGADGKRRDCGVDALVDVARQGVAAGVATFVKQDCARKPGQQGRIPADVWALKQFPTPRSFDA